MKYMGGKFRQSKHIARFTKMVLSEEVTYVEPFCGAMGSATAVDHNKMVLSDSSEALINMWRTLENENFILPDFVSEEEYNEIKNIKDPKDWRTAYYGFGLSFGGKFFGGYARGKENRNYALESKNRTDKKRAILFNKSEENLPALVCCDYKDIEKHIPRLSVVYCDPPYKNRNKPYDFVGSFNHQEFWQWCRDMVKKGHIILATEFIVPDDFHVLYNFGDTVVRHHASLGADGTQEVLVCHESQKHLFV
jgi:DNA adenine methylase